MFLLLRRGELGLQKGDEAALIIRKNELPPIAVKSGGSRSGLGWAGSPGSVNSAAQCYQDDLPDLPYSACVLAPLIFTRLQ